MVVSAPQLDTAWQVNVHTLGQGGKYGNPDPAGEDLKLYSGGSDEEQEQMGEL